MRIAPAVGVSTFLLSAPALAHHAMDGRLPQTFAEGLLSGFAHPVIGVDHLLATIAVGLLCALVARGAWLAGLFVLAGPLGTGLHLLRVNLPVPEVMVAATVALLGLALMLRRRRAGTGRPVLPGWLALLGLAAGIVHGYAFGESIAGAQRVALGAYLLGFTAIQLGLILLVRRLGSSAAARSERSAARLQALSGGALSIAGAALVVVALRV